MIWRRILNPFSTSGFLRSDTSTIRPIPGDSQSLVREDHQIRMLRSGQRRPAPRYELPPSHHH